MGPTAYGGDQGSISEENEEETGRPRRIRDERIVQEVDGGAREFS